jgi:hypothetical protein
MRIVIISFSNQYLMQHKKTKQPLKKNTKILIATTIFIILFLQMSHISTNNSGPYGFDGNRAFKDIETQIDFGPRYHGSRGHANTIEWLRSSLESSGWQVLTQNGIYQNVYITNIIAHRGSEAPDIILGAHYDTRMFADKDPNPANLTNPVPGANDGASGVAVLLEIARVLPDDFHSDIWLVFFDAEDNGNIPGWDWILGSRFFVENMKYHPDAMVLLDMVGDKELQIFKERSSSSSLSDSIWIEARKLGYGKYFPSISRHTILDDHIPFIEAGISSVNIIDFDYPYHHTIEDTVDKVSAKSLQIVGDTILSWLDKYEE